ncbi:2-hydroxyglutaryl-CoA dehydratase D-component [Ammonifex degensii KC4]|uniref:2-hydroxyglutaryl-CoA dehydratase D-component n=1 Tax=Ammonifex degensii (strain DSM 10501 / KC4) TaxID=429009 RepID=C9R920_AMMDK|nr:2-hydroxyacyl-CoA dehydratase family protein [Ammonifex degensii]ACX52799.1 2-hydroxyglutaryl-CoA dehydratase D-component [Ammonifex degensii KC4]
MNFYEHLKARVAEGLKRQALTSPWTYRVLKTLARRSSFPLRFQQKLTLFALEETERAFRPRSSPVVFTSAFFPTEIVRALGYVVFSPEVAAALASSLGLASSCLREAEGAWYGRDTCSFHRCAAGALELGLFPKPDALCASTHLCDGAPQLFANLARRLRVPFFLLDVPQEESPEALEYVGRQLERIYRQLAELGGKKPEEGALAGALEASERFRRALLRIESCRKKKSFPLPPDFFLNNLVYLTFVGQGSGEAAELVELLAEELENLSPSPGRVRLLWLHLKPYHDSSLMACLAQRGVTLAGEEMTHVYWPELDPFSPFMSLARKVLSHFAHGPATRRAATLRRLVKEQACDGVVCFAHWGCRQSSGAVEILRECFSRWGIPFLVLEGDCVDGSAAGKGQVLTRLEAFLEILGG